MGCVRLARYFGKMYSRHLFSLFPVQTAQSQHPSAHFDGIRIHDIRYEPHTLSYLWGLSDSFFQKLHWFCTAAKLFHQVIWERTKQKASTALHDGSFKCLHFMMSYLEARQRTQTNSWECAVQTGDQLWPYVSVTYSLQPNPMTKHIPRS